MNSSHNNKLAEIDWSFPSLGNSGIHSVHWYPATYISAIPGTLIPLLSKRGSTILDPFCGSGTSGLESLRLGNRFIGIDTNPIALLMTDTKLYHPDPSTFEKLINKIVTEAEISLGAGKVTRHPQEIELNRWYHPNTTVELNSLLDQIISISSKKVRRCALGIFSSTLKGLSSQGKHWGWVCDNVRPKPNEITYKDAYSTFLTATANYVKSSAASFQKINEMTAHNTRKEIREDYALLQGSCIEQMAELRKGSVDLIMTSPPYYGVADYIKSQRLSYLWFDLDALSDEKLGFRDFENLRKQESGSRAYRHRRSSWEEYMEFISKFFAASSNVLKKKAHMALVMGESKSREATSDAILEAASDEGFKLVLRKGRDIKSTRRRLMAKLTTEDVLIFENLRN